MHTGIIEIGVSTFKNLHAVIKQVCKTLKHTMNVTIYSMYMLSWVLKK